VVGLSAQSISLALKIKLLKGRYSHSIFDRSFKCLLHSLIIPVLGSIIFCPENHLRMNALVANRFRVSRADYRDIVIQYDYAYPSIDGLIALIFNVATVVDTMAASAAVRIRVVAITQEAAALDQGFGMFADDKHKLL